MLHFIAVVANRGRGVCLIINDLHMFSVTSLHLLSIN